MTTHFLDRVPAPLRPALERRGFTELTAVQEAVLSSMEAAGGEARDLQISSQTGSGKTIALGLVAASTLLDPEEAQTRGPSVLVIVPTRELAAQVRGELSRLFEDVSMVTLDCVTGGTNPGHERGRLQRRPRILVGTPGRLLDHLKSGGLSVADVRHLVLDEADQMLDMGFREDLEAILEGTPAERRTHLVSATFPPAILRLAERYQQNPLPVEGTRLGAANEDIEHIAYRVNERDRYSALVNLLIMGGEERTLVFVNRRADTTTLADQLTQDGFSALPLSGELVQAQRTRTLAAFKSGRASILVATDVASRGLDVPDVATVVHAEPGFDSEVYTHRSGRTGRAGRKGQSLILVPVRKEHRVRQLLSHARVNVQWRAVPTASKVAKHLEKQARRATWEAIANAPDPSEERLTQAKRLLEDRDPVQVLATILEIGHSQKGPKAHDLTAPSSAPAPYSSGGARDNRRSYDRGGRGARADRGERTHQGYGARPGGGYPTSRPSQGARTGGARFRINWGANDGANPKRLLAHICRRGGIQGRDVGAIRLDEHSSSFEINPRVARDFEARARRRDSRDPHLRIEAEQQGHRPPRRDLARV